MIFVRKARRNLASVLLAGLFFSPVSCKSKEEPVPAAPPSAAVHPVAPDFTLKDLHGKTWTLSKMKGHVVFLEFWATWCGPCRMSMPQVEKLHLDYKGKNVQVLGLNLDEQPDPVAPFVQEMDVRYPILFVGTSGADNKYQVSGIPTFVLIDKAGRVANGWVGFDQSFPDQWRRSIDALLAQ